jgi:hypothetical protein
MYTYQSIEVCLLLDPATRFGTVTSYADVRVQFTFGIASAYYCYTRHHHHHPSFMELGHLLTRSGLTCPEADSEAKGSNPTTGLALLWARNPFRGNFKHWQVSQKKAVIHVRWLKLILRSKLKF